MQKEKIVLQRRLSYLVLRLDNQMDCHAIFYICRCQRKLKVIICVYFKKYLVNLLTLTMHPLWRSWNIANISTSIGLFWHHFSAIVTKNKSCTVRDLSYLNKIYHFIQYYRMFFKSPKKTVNLYGLYWK